MTELNDKQLEEAIGGLDVPGTHDAPTYNPIYVTQPEQEVVSTSVPIIEIK